MTINTEEPYKLTRITKDGNDGKEAFKDMCGNDKAHSMKICNAPVNMEIRIYDNGTPQLTEKEDHNDDYLRVFVRKTMVGCQEFSSLESPPDTEYLGGEFVGNGNRELNGHVSSFVHFRGIANIGIYF